MYIIEHTQEQITNCTTLITTTLLMMTLDTDLAKHKSILLYRYQTGQQTWGDLGGWTVQTLDAVRKRFGPPSPIVQFLGHKDAMTGMQISWPVIKCGRVYPVHAKIKRPKGHIVKNLEALFKLIDRGRALLSIQYSLEYEVVQIDEDEGVCLRGLKKIQQSDLSQTHFHSFTGERCIAEHIKMARCVFIPKIKNQQLCSEASEEQFGVII